MEVRVPVDTEGGCLARTFCLLKDLMVLLPDLGETMDGAFSGMTDAGMLNFFVLCGMNGWTGWRYFARGNICDRNIEANCLSAGVGREEEGFNLLCCFIAAGWMIPRCVGTPVGGISHLELIAGPTRIITASKVRARDASRWLWHAGITCMSVLCCSRRDMPWARLKFGE